MTAHNLKIYPEYYEAVTSGAKTFELRFNDRNYHVGDTLRLREYVPHTQTYTSRETTVTVTYILESVTGLQDGYCILGITP